MWNKAAGTVLSAAARAAIYGESAVLSLLTFWTLLILTASTRGKEDSHSPVSDEQTETQKRLKV